MDLFKEIYHEKFKPVLLPLGFKPHGRGFYRRINDVIQIIGIYRKTIMYGYCTLYYSIYPMCWEEGLTKTILDGCGWTGEDISELMQTTRMDVQYQKNNIVEINQVIDVLLNQLVNYVLPHFDQSYDCKSAHDAAYKIASQQRGIYPVHDDNVPLHNQMMLYCILKAGDYDTANRYIDEWDQYDDKSNKEYMERSDIDISEKKRYAAALSKMQEDRKAFIDMIRSKDKERIDAYLAANEAITKKNFGWKD